MNNKKNIFISILVFMMLLSIGAISAADTNNNTISAADTNDAISAADTNDAIASNKDNSALKDSEPTSSGTVSGGVDVVTENPWNKSGELSYDIPSNAKTIKSADVYVNIYGVKLDDSFGVETNTTIKTDNGNTTYKESLSYNAEDKTKVYTVNDHVTKSYLDYMIHYDITNQLTGLNGTNLKIEVNTSSMEGKATASNVGFIKLIGLILTYDDGDSDIINYWINDNQLWTNSNTTLTFDTRPLTDVLEMYLTNIALSSSDGTYKINDEFLTDSEHKSGDYYQYNKWDVTDYFNSSKTELLAIGTPGDYGVSYKNSLSVLVAKSGEMKANISLFDERNYNNNHIAYAGTYNQITINVTTNKNGKYKVELLADGNIVNSTEIYLTSGTTPIKLIDPTIRPINEDTAYVKDKYNNVTYTAKLLSNNELVNESSLKAAILYNGYFAKDLEYPGQDYESFYNGIITGDIVIDVCKNGYASSTTNRTDTWTVTLQNNSNFVKAWIYVAYCYGGADTIDLFNVEFNGKKPVAVSFKRDQANIPSTSGYGLIVYDVTDLIKSGENILVLNKTHSTGAYPSTLIYLYNTTDSTVIKNVYINNGADIIGSTGNTAKRNIQLDTTLNINSVNIDSATAYIFGAGSKTGRASIIINGEENTTAWDTEQGDQINVYKKDITNNVKDENKISILLKKDMFTALQQIIVTTTNKTKPTPVTPPSNNTNKTNNTTPTTTPSTQTTKTTTSKTKVTLTTAKTTTVSKKAKKLVLSTKLKVNKKISKGKKVTFIVNGKKYKVKTNKKGVAKLTIKKSDLKKILKKSKVGKKIKYQIVYGKQKITRYIKIKK